MYVEEYGRAALTVRLHRILSTFGASENRPQLGQKQFTAAKAQAAFLDR